MRARRQAGTRGPGQVAPRNSSRSMLDHAATLGTDLLPSGSGQAHFRRRGVRRARHGGCRRRQRSAVAFRHRRAWRPWRPSCWCCIRATAVEAGCRSGGRRRPVVSES